MSERGTQLCLERQQRQLRQLLLLRCRGFPKKTTSASDLALKTLSGYHLQQHPPKASPEMNKEEAPWSDREWAQIGFTFLGPSRRRYAMKIRVPAQRMCLITILTILLAISRVPVEGCALSPLQAGFESFSKTSLSQPCCVAALTGQQRASCQHKSCTRCH